MNLKSMAKKENNKNLNNLDQDCQNELVLLG
jgi:hypothetical protein